MRQLLALGLFACLLGFPVHAATVAYYEFDGTGTTAIGSTVTDATGNHPGSVAGGSLVYGSDSLVGGYLSFAADASGANTGNRVVIPGAADFLFTVDQAYTLEVIFRTTQVTVNGVLLSKGGDVSNPDSQWWLRHNGAGRAQGLVEGVDNTTEDSATSSAPTALVNDGKWHHVALVFDGTAAPKRLNIFVDGTWAGADASVGTLGIIGGVDTDPVILGEFASGAANRSFAGDIAAVRFSNAALAPSEFLALGFTYISDLVPTNNASFLPASTVASFVVNSPTIGVVQTNIQVSLNGNNISSQLSFTGTDGQRTVTLPALAANQIYRMDIAVTDNVGNLVTRNISFNTFSSNLQFVEGEDYNFESGQFIDNPPLSSNPGPNSYLDRLGVEGVDFHQTNTPPKTLYRISDQVGTDVSTDLPRQAYLDAGVSDYMATNHANSEWLNYTRTFPANTYRVYARLAKSGTVPVVLRLDEVTSGSTTPSQTLAPIGFFRRLPTLTASDFDFLALTDALENEVAVPLSGVKTLRLTMVSGTTGMNLNYLLFVPPGGVQRPFLASVSPAAGEGNAAFNAPIQATIRNGDATVSTGTIQLRLDGAGVSPSVVPTSTGATVSYSPSVMSTGLHTATLTFTDSTATSNTNQWQFYVANQAVRGRWNFNEQTAGNSASTNAGAILDASGNSRHGTASAAGQAYVVGSFNYGNTPALKFTTGADRVVVPDPSGSFNFTGSFTFEAVLRTTNSGTAAAILAKNGTGDGEGEYWWRTPGATGGKQRVGMNGYFLAGTNTLNDGKWHHVAVVFDQAAGEIRLYADYSPDGLLSAVSFDRPVGRPADLQIGGFIGTTTSEFDGDIDLIRISESALTPDQFVERTVPLEPIVKSLLPASGGRGVAPKPLIQAEFQNRDTAVELSTLRLSVDGQDVTGSATKTGDAAGAKISYTPGTALATGAHTATTTFTDTGVPARSWTNSWSFTVLSSVPVLAFYQLNEKAAGSEADPAADAILDSSGNGRHLTAAGSPLPQYAAGAPNYGNTSAMAFTSGDDNLHTANTAGLNFGVNDSFTLEAVVRTASGATFTGNIVGRDWNTALPSWWFRLNAGLPAFLVAQNGGPEPGVTASTAVNDGEWHHVAAVRDALTRKLRVYVDYNFAGEGADTTTLPLTNAQNLVIGAYNAGTRQFEGEIDFVRITGEALDPSWFIPLGGVVSLPAVALTDVGLAGNSISFSFATQSGFSYVVQSTDALGGTWGDLETISGNGSVRTVSYAISGAHRFFRVEVRSN